MGISTSEDVAEVLLVHETAALGLNTGLLLAERWRWKIKYPPPTRTSTAMITITMMISKMTFRCANYPLEFPMTTKTKRLAAIIAPWAVALAPTPPSPYAAAS